MKYIREYVLPNLASVTRTRLLHHTPSWQAARAAPQMRWCLISSRYVPIRPSQAVKGPLSQELPWRAVPEVRANTTGSEADRQGNSFPPYHEQYCVLCTMYGACGASAEVVEANY